MNKNEIKDFLRNNPTYIENVLKELNCSHIKTIQGKRVQSTRPNGDNPTSLQIKLNNNLSAIVYTDNNYSNTMEYNDIFSIVQYFNKCSLNESINFVCKICGLSYSYSTKSSKRSKTYELLKRLKQSKDNSDEISETTYPEWFKTRFIREDCEMFLKDNINSNTQEKFYVAYDSLDNRVVFPIRNMEGEIVTFKGRTLDKEWKEKGVPKYIYYYPYNGRNHLYGYYENYYTILSSKEVFVGEAEKFVQQLDSMGINNALAISKKTISPIQLNLLLKLQKDIVLAFDKDVELEDIYIECRKFKGLCRVFYIYDKDNLLGNKDSPTDKGQEIWNKLSSEYKFEYKEGE